MFRKAIFLCAGLVFSQANASHYGMAGCGLGSLVFKDEPGKVQIVAATINNLVSPQTSAITSGTSGCYEDSGATAQLNYIETNKEALKVDVARGNGESLKGLSLLMGCKNTVDFNSTMKSNYSEIFGSDDSQVILNTIKSNNSVQKSCGTLG